MVSYRGRGQKQYTEQCYGAPDEWPGCRPQKYAKHVGSTHHLNGKVTFEVKRRMGTVRNSYSSFKRFLTRPRIKHRRRGGVYKVVVRGTGLYALEVRALRRSHYEMFEKEQIRQLRSMLRKYGYGVLKGGAKGVARTDDQIREHWECPTIILR